MIVLMLILLLTGYLHAQKASNDTAAVREFISSEVVIYGKNYEERRVTFSSPEEALKSLSQTKLISRGAFGLEPVISGFGDGPAAITIDGMKIHGACTDKMDPVSSYVEPENIGSIVLTSSQSPGGGVSATAGTINFITQKPEFETPLSVISDNYFSHNGNAIKSGTILNYSASDYAVRLSGTYKASSDFRAGKNYEVTNSGYKKFNAKGDFSLLVGEENTLTASYLGDFARDVGYPALIMDARKATGQLFSLSLAGNSWLNGLNNSILRLYYNRVDHSMDDYSRTQDEIAARHVMPGMYMPMAGKFSTTGALFNSNYNIADGVAGIMAHFTNQRFYAEMEMISLNPAVPKMFMLNIGDAEDYSYSLGISYTTEMSDDLVVKFMAGGEYVSRHLTNETGQQLNSVYEPGFSPLADYLLPSAGIEADYFINRYWDIKLSFNYNTRAPLMAESYGYFLYSPMDDAFYAGNSALKPESGLRLGAELQFDDGHFSFFTSGHLLLLQNFIAGDFLGGTENNINGIPFKQYINAGNALTMNLSSGISYDYHNYDFILKASFQEGHSYYFNDKLPLQPPAEIDMTIRYSEEAWYASISGHTSFPQKHVSAKLAMEKELPGYFILNAETALTLFENITFYLTAENLLDKFYVTRYSVNNFPMSGRNIRTGVLLKYE